MEAPSPWLTQPREAYHDWQVNEAAGADRRAFSQRSIVQHVAMFDRLLRFLTQHHTTLATFGPDHLGAFFEDVEKRCEPGTTTRLRYFKLVDRLCRHLVEIGLREANPAASFAEQAWPEAEPIPLFLDAAADAALQAYVQDLASDDTRAARSRAVVALLLGTGITAVECRLACAGDVTLIGERPEIRVPKRGPRLERVVALPPFSLPALLAWQNHRPVSARELLFVGPQTPDRPVNDALLGTIVRDALDAIGFVAPDMSPRVLRNTFARRALLAGKSNADVTRLLGLASQRTAIRMRATLPRT
ncbi:site-specific integrase (plasmid) [Paraburkholderia sp. D15]|uniref:tyrosine-type recombinase/integrase n=1 Tax=Paraburkholderia sp. D15 TaxID=2880218 RepID=UPI00247A1B11|nr:tyrosine-type recombinase/integrase [Paraburkholderia sp. D15]WGS55043.1 site-specific integrase [Paraburkholderia sp. D15]